MTSAEVERLLRVADIYGRSLFYRLAIYARLGRSEIQELKWGQVDMQEQTITVRRGKTEVVIPTHADIHHFLSRASRGTPAASVFPTMVSDSTRRKDFKRARVPLVDAAGRRVRFYGSRKLQMRLLT